MADSSRYGQPWTRTELVLAFELYCRIPFSKTKATNPAVRHLASAIGRTPASVARKLGNFGAFDPQLQERSISGLGHGSKLDEEIWTEFNNDWESLVLQAQHARKVLEITPQPEATWAVPRGPSERLRTGKQRLHQTFFREAVLSSYVGRCAVTGLSVAECLIASHIIPWSESVEARANPQNGICLSATMDCLFDRGLMTVQDNYTVILSPRIIAIQDEQVQRQVVGYNERPMLMPERFYPNKAFLAWHREHRFQKN